MVHSSVYVETKSFKLSKAKALFFPMMTDYRPRILCVNFVFAYTLVYMCCTATCAVLLHVLYCFMCCTASCAVLLHVLYCYMCCTATCVVLLHVLYCFMCCTATCVVLLHVLYCFKCCTATCDVLLHVLYCFMCCTATCSCVRVKCRAFQQYHADRIVRDQLR